MTTNLVYCRWALEIMESGNKNCKGVDMVDTHIELILQHPCPLIAATYNKFLPPELGVSIHFFIYSRTYKDKKYGPNYQGSPKPTSWDAQECAPLTDRQLFIQHQSHHVVALLLFPHQNTLFSSSMLSSSFQPFKTFPTSSLSLRKQ